MYEAEYARKFDILVEIDYSDNFGVPSELEISVGDCKLYESTGAAVLRRGHFIFI